MRTEQPGPQATFNTGNSGNTVGLTASNHRGFPPRRHSLSALRGKVSLRREGSVWAQSTWQAVHYHGDRLPGQPLLKARVGWGSEGPHPILGRCTAQKKAGSKGGSLIALLATCRGCCTRARQGLPGSQEISPNMAARTGPSPHSHPWWLSSTSSYLTDSSPQPPSGGHNTQEGSSLPQTKTKVLPGRPTLLAGGPRPVSLPSPHFHLLLQKWGHSPNNSEGRKRVQGGGRARL